MADIVTRRELEDAKVDARDLGKAVNEKVIVSPRYGDDFKSLPLLSDEAQDTIGEWQDAINTITVNDGVPALAVSTANGENQQAINDYNGVKWRNKAGGYALNARVQLENGDIVKSTVAGNTVNPNVDMTGWENLSEHNSLKDRNIAGAHLASAIAYDSNLTYSANTVGRALSDINRDNIIVTGNAEFPEFGMQSGVKINGVPLKRPFDMRGYHFEKPQGFGWNVNGHNFWLDKDGILKSDINPSDYDVASKAVGVVEYFVSSLGTDTSSNLGTDPSSPLRSVNGAINRINTDLVENAVIWMQPTNYDDGFTWASGTAISSTVSIKPWNMSLAAPYADTSETPIVFSANDTSLGWVLTSGNTYQKTRASTSAITDSSIINKYGDPSFYEKALSLQECNETAGTWFQDGSTLYVHTLDNRVPDSNINVYVAKTLGKATTGNFSLYIERTHFHGGTLPLSVLIEAGASEQTVFLNKCRFRYGNENGLQIRGVRLTICYECESAYNRDDGLNYHSELGGKTRPTKVIEFKCKSYRNGQSWSPLSLTNQGSTTHDASHIARAGCVYFDNGRQAITDVGDSRSWIISCQGYAESEKRYEGSYYSVFQCAEGKMWLDHCDATGHDYALASTDNGQLYVRNCNIYPRIYTAHNMQKW